MTMARLSPRRLRALSHPPRGCPTRSAPSRDPLLPSGDSEGGTVTVGTPGCGDRLGGDIGRGDGDLLVTTGDMGLGLRAVAGIDSVPWDGSRNPKSFLLLLEKGFQWVPSWGKGRVCHCGHQGHHHGHQVPSP